MSRRLILDQLFSSGQNTLVRIGVLGSLAQGFKAESARCSLLSQARL